MSQRLIVIGGGGAGISAATTAKRVDPDLRVVALHRVRGHRLLAVRDPVRARQGDPDASRTCSSPPSSATSRTGSTCTWRRWSPTSTSSAGRSPRAARTTGFDKLIVCTGFRGRSPTCRARTSTGLHYVKNIRAAMEFDKLLDDLKRIVVVGSHPLASRWPATSATAASRCTSSTRARGCSARSSTRTSPGRCTSRSRSAA